MTEQMLVGMIDSTRGFTAIGLVFDFAIRDLSPPPPPPTPTGTGIVATGNLVPPCRAWSPTGDYNVQLSYTSDTKTMTAASTTDRLAMQDSYISRFERRAPGQRSTGCPSLNPQNYDVESSEAGVSIFANLITGQKI